ncbi:conserved hypothetical protein [Thiomonas arsenitoxydans]|uniref:Uncharacterized protein n=1 Tax=Thiomonas arsenitoxydans (strain DSM 22701 / CIP 110005 / 3As) TaxID=426114 RepID=D6CNW2_THIA3|nr:hypothetical protein THI_0588 [Thiomonas arsenitoxydans]CAZ90240.1 hypothetical protein THI_3659 [Thiomonas arsenitoxydans]CQR28917.1 conserved hypothetical protein [Thiomonas arsenitoxydans]CQR28918.1 conserved hypothetical protein [Thiomonas arsenitoxydans]CQR30372.1 conserved hypothetical protein [Thiomonas arsenitoxydans]
MVQVGGVYREAQRCVAALRYGRMCGTLRRDHAWRSQVLRRSRASTQRVSARARMASQFNM